MEEEVFISGFCKNQNQGRTVILAYEDQGQERELVDVNCAYGNNCPHQGACQVAKQIDEVLGTGN